MSDIGARLRLERERRGKTQYEVAEEIGVRALEVSRWERGVTEPSGRNVVRINAWLEGE